MNGRRKYILALVSLGLLLLPFPGVYAQQANTDGETGNKVTVYRSPSCGCCGAWIEHMRQNGFEVIEHQTADMESVKSRYGVPLNLRSCHTAIVDGYVIEGHVPATELRQLLGERPKVKGLAVPGMPSGSPGMEMGGRKDSYSVLTFTADGDTAVYHEYRH